MVRVRFILGTLRSVRKRFQLPIPGGTEQVQRNASFAGQKFHLDWESGLQIVIVGRKSQEVLAGREQKRVRNTALRVLFLLVAAIGGLRSASIRASALPDTLLPAGFLSTRGSQIVGSDGVPVRIASVGVSGMNVVGGRLQLEGPFESKTMFPQWWP